MEKQKRLWKKSRYGTYYQKSVGKDVQMPISETKRYGTFYQKVTENKKNNQTKIINGEKNCKHRRADWKKVGRYDYKESRYFNYYYRSYVNHINKINWKRYLKRIKDLKKEVKSFGKIPIRGSSFITIIKYFVRLVNAVTSFCDEGMLYIVPKEKAEHVNIFNDIIINISCREKAIIISWISKDIGKERMAEYLNLSKQREKVNYNNMFLGIYSQTLEGEDISKINTAIINDKRYRIDVFSSPIADWITKKAKDVYGNNITDLNVSLTDVNVKLNEALMSAIDRVLA